MFCRVTFTVLRFTVTGAAEPKVWGVTVSCFITGNFKALTVISLMKLFWLPPSSKQWTLLCWPGPSSHALTVCSSTVLFCLAGCIFTECEAKGKKNTFSLLSSASEVSLSFHTKHCPIFNSLYFCAAILCQFLDKVLFCVLLCHRRGSSNFFDWRFPALQLMTCCAFCFLFQMMSCVLTVFW